MEVGWDDGGGGDWWKGACEEDTVSSGLDPEALLASGFLPPPPRPPGFLDPPSDGLTTCDLCAWATQQTSTLDSLSFMSWSVTLVIVSVISAAVGAAIMVSLRRCLNKINENPVTRGYSGRGEGADKVRSVGERRPQAGGLCCWITRRSSTRQPSLRTDVVTAANHYTLEETYSAKEEEPKTSGGAEALYAELDRPVYQNTGYVLEPDTGSPPSSAYYSDLSDKTYETVGNAWEMHRYRGHHHHHHHQQSSDYV